MTTPKSAAMIGLLGGTLYKAVAFSTDEFRAINKLYGYTKEKPNKKPPPPEPPKREDFGSDWDFSVATTSHERQLAANANWTDPRPLFQAGADRNALRHAEADGLRMLAWIAKFVEKDEDPVRVLIRMAIDAGFDVDPTDIEWAEESAEESEVE